MIEPLLQVRDLRKHFPVRGGLWRRPLGWIKAVDGVDLTLAAGETLGVVGESGCGKSTLGRSVLRLLEPTGGRVHLDGRDVRGASPRALRALRREMQIVFQDPYEALSPRRTVHQTLREPLDAHALGRGPERERRIAELMELVGLGPGLLRQYPHELSGGQRQRVGIARALALRPKLIVADEPVSALDVSVQSQVLNLLARAQRELGVALLFIAHDLAVVRHISDRVAVMYLGRIVEQASASTLFASPKHPYTQALISAIPMPDPRAARPGTSLRGEVPSPMRIPPGCPFHNRCPQAMPVCRSVVPRTVDVGGAGGSHWVSCHLHDPAMAGRTE